LPLIDATVEHLIGDERFLSQTIHEQEEEDDSIEEHIIPYLVTEKKFV